MQQICIIRIGIYLNMLCENMSPSQSHPIYKAVQLSEKAEDFVSTPHHHNGLARPIIEELIEELKQAELRVWQWQTCKAFFNAQMKYYACERSLIRYAEGSESNDYIDTVLSGLKKESKLRESNAIVVGVQTEIISKINRICMLIS